MISLSVIEDILHSVAPKRRPNSSWIRHRATMTNHARPFHRSDAFAPIYMVGQSLSRGQSCKSQSANLGFKNKCRWMLEGCNRHYLIFNLIIIYHLIKGATTDNKLSDFEI